MSTSERVIRTKAKRHPPYKLADGSVVVGTTTVIGVINKEALKYWANKIGLQGIKITDYVDSLAAVGTAAHAAILADLSGYTAESALDGLDDSIRDLASNSYLSFCEWRKRHELKPLVAERRLVSEAMRYGGTPDFLGLVDGELELLDFKTGGIWPEQFIQLAAYENLVYENNLAEFGSIKKFRILSIPRAESEQFSEQVKSTVADEWEAFKHALSLYGLLKKIRKEK